MPPTIEAAAGRLGLGPIDQVSYVVADMDASLPLYEAIYGPFEVAEARMDRCWVRGASADCTLKLAVNRSGPIEIELIEVREGETPHSEHLRARGEGLHHVRFRVASLEQKLEELEREGFEVVFRKRFGPNVAFAYVETPAALGRSLLELLELP